MIGPFGMSENVKCIVDIPAQGAKDEALCLAFRTRIQWAVGGVYLSDDGYVVRAREGTDSGSTDRTYYPLTAQMIAVQQREGTLPTPLPSYQIPLRHYLSGYSMWLGLLLLVAYFAIRRKLRTR